jgi:hypothetical protein
VGEHERAYMHPPSMHPCTNSPIQQREGPLVRAGRGDGGKLTLRGVVRKMNEDSQRRLFYSLYGHDLPRIRLPLRCGSFLIHQCGLYA